MKTRQQKIISQLNHIIWEQDRTPSVIAKMLDDVLGDADPETHSKVSVCRHCNRFHLNEEMHPDFEPPQSLCLDCNIHIREQAADYDCALGVEK